MAANVCFLNMRSLRRAVRFVDVSYTHTEPPAVVIPTDMSHVDHAVTSHATNVHLAAALRQEHTVT